MIVVKTLFCEVQAVCQQRIQYARVMLLQKPASTHEAIVISLVWSLVLLLVFSKVAQQKMLRQKKNAVLSFAVLFSFSFFGRGSVKLLTSDCQNVLKVLSDTLLQLWTMGTFTQFTILLQRSFIISVKCHFLFNNNSNNYKSELKITVRCSCTHKIFYVVN